MKAVTVRYEYLRGGQPRPYADTETVWRLTFTNGETWFTDGREWLPKERKTVLRFLEAVAGWKWDGYKNEGQDYFDSYLDYCNEVSPGVWEARTVRPFTD